jgi:hypothetical protein
MTRETDIVERLRSCNRQHCDEAADEIERLRADLDKSAKLAYSAVRTERAAIGFYRSA